SPLVQSTSSSVTPFDNGAAIVLLFRSETRAVIIRKHIHSCDTESIIVWPLLEPVSALIDEAAKKLAPIRSQRGIGATPSRRALGSCAQAVQANCMVTRATIAAGVVADPPDTSTNGNPTRGFTLH